MMALRPALAVPQTPEEMAWAAHAAGKMQSEGAYLMEQATKPQTLAMALMDSPMGTAAWILEKFHGWSDLRERGLLEVYTRDQLLTNVMIYLVTDSIATSVWYYNALFQEGGAQLAEGQRCETPTAFASYPGEQYILAPPRSWAERAYNISRWSEPPRGGHFAAMEAPEIYVADIWDWARSV
jgi:microsomal epoxide hydrolase